MENYSTNHLFINSSHSHSDMSATSNSLFSFVFSILLVIVMCIGVTGNVLVIYVVINYGRLKTVTNTYLLHLAFSDLIFLSGIPFFISSIMNRAWMFGGVLCKLFFLTQGVNQYTSIIILALLAFDRFLAVCYSTKSVVWRSRVNPNLLLILAWILSFFLMLPIIMFTTIVTMPSADVQCIIIFPYGDSRLLYFVFVIYTLTITFVLPLSLMICFYIRIVCRLRRRLPEQHRRSRASLQTRRRVSVLVLSVITVHILCCSPYWTFQVITTSELISQSSALLVPMSSIAQLLLFVNSSSNPILYAFLSGTFRLSFKHVFYCCLSTNHDQYLREKPIVKRSLSWKTGKRNANHGTKEQTIPMKTVELQLNSLETKTNERCLSNLAHEINIHDEHKPFVSSAPNVSILNSDASYNSDL